MLRIGPFGGGIMPTRPGADDRAPAKGGDLSRLVVMVVLAGVVGILAIGFFLKGADRPRVPGASPAASGTDDGPMREVPPEKMTLTPVQDPGDPEADGPDAPPADPPAPAAAPEPGAAPPAAPGPGPDGPPAEGPRPVAVPPFQENESIYDDVEQYGGTIEPRALWHLMHKVVTTDAQALRSQVKEIRFKDFFKDPDALVGKPVRFVGRLYQVQGAESDKFPADPMNNPSGVTNAVWGYVVDSGFKPCHFYAPSLPPEIRTKQIVQLDGYFLKIYTFENATGNQMRAPLLVVRNIVEEPPIELEPIVWFGIPLVVGGHILSWLEVALLLVVIITVPTTIWYVRVERRNYMEFRQKAIERRRKHVGASGAFGEKSAPDAAGPPPTADAAPGTADAAPPVDPSLPGDAPPPAPSEAAPPPVAPPPDAPAPGSPPV